MQSTANSDPTIPDVAVAHFPCPPQFRQEFGYTYVTLVVTREGFYAVVDPHRSSRRIVLDAKALERLSTVVALPGPMAPAAAA